MTTTARLTLEQFLKLPEQKPALEFDANGTIHVKMSPNTDHAALQVQIALILRRWTDADLPRRRGYVYSELRTNVAGASKLPDVALYRSRPRESKRKHAIEVANVAIEILSPRDDIDEQYAKCEWYLDNGAEVALLVDPVARSVTRFRSGGEIDVWSSPSKLLIVPGLELSLDEVFSILDD